MTRKSGRPSGAGRTMRGYGAAFGAVLLLSMVPPAFAHDTPSVQVIYSGNVVGHGGVGGTSHLSVYACDDRADDRGIYITWENNRGASSNMGDDNGSVAGCATRQLTAPATRFRICINLRWWEGSDTCSDWVNA
jgi:hypothetical protein